ncbi:MAG: carbonic anhydrase [Chthoniobacterales bacterium]
MCDQHHSSEQTGLSRRNFLKLTSLTTAAIAGAALAGLSSAYGKTAFVPKPQNVLTPDQAINRLVKGNARYINGQAKPQDFISERPALVKGQNPFAGVLSCADSRVAPEYAFDTGRGDLFVVRLAGNFLDKEGLASFEFGVAVLNVPLIVVLGHESCGAVDSTIDAVTKGATFPGHIPELVKALKPAVLKAQKMPGNLLENATQENVVLNVQKLRNASPIISKFVKDGKVKIVGGVYHLATGKVQWVA